MPLITLEKDDGVARLAGGGGGRESNSLDEVEDRRANRSAPARAGKRLKDLMN